MVSPGDTRRGTGFRTAWLALGVVLVALVGAGVKIVFNYTEALIDSPSDVQVHTSNPAADLLHALYFHLT